MTMEVSLTNQTLKMQVWFWQRMVTPHMSGIATALASQGCTVTFVAEQLMSEDRASQGWKPLSLGSVRLELAPTAKAVAALVAVAPDDSIHICQGIRGNGLVGIAQQELADRGLRQWVSMETVDDSGWRGFLKRLEYRRLFWLWRMRIEGVLAIGYRTPHWLVARGLPVRFVFPFAYFLPVRDFSNVQGQMPSERFRFVFVGQFIERKYVDLLIAALPTLSRNDVELTVIGSGPLEGDLKIASKAALPGRVNWIGQLPMDEVLKEIAKADCLVLPSRADGWGSVVVEALMVGTPAICSNGCGSAGLVRASGCGGVFKGAQGEFSRRSSRRFLKDLTMLVRQLEQVLAKGKLSAEERRALASWAECLGVERGALYLKTILQHKVSVSGQRAFWESARLAP